MLCSFNDVRDAQKIVFRSDPNEPDLPQGIWDDFVSDAAAINRSANLVSDDRAQRVTLDCSGVSRPDWWAVKWDSAKLAEAYRDRMAEYNTHSYC